MTEAVVFYTPFKNCMNIRLHNFFNIQMEFNFSFEDSWRSFLVHQYFRFTAIQICLIYTNKPNHRFVFPYYDIFPILTRTSIMTRPIVTRSTRRVRLVSKGYSLLLGTWSYLYTFGGPRCSALNLYFMLWIFEMAEDCYCHFSLKTIINYF